MSRIGWMLVGALAVLAAEGTSSADDLERPPLPVWSAACSKGSVELRLDCLTRKVEQIEARLDGRLVQVVPLGPDEAPAPAPASPRIMPAPLPAQPSAPTPPR
jgi:hypothetical protein